MKTIGKLKLTQLSKADLEARQMNMLRGGDASCSCGCHYANNEGSSSCDNDYANYKSGKTSYGGGEESCTCLNSSESCTAHDFWHGK